MKPYRHLAFAAALALAACGGSHTGGAPVLPSTGGTKPNVKTATVNFVLRKSASTSASSARTPAFVSRNIQSIAITVASNGATPGPATNVNCAATQCSAQLTVPIGPATFAVKAYDQIGEQGNLLSTGSAAANIVQNQANNVTVTFNPVVKNVQLSILSSFTGTTTTFTTGSAGVPEGAPYHATLTITAYDPSGAIIMAPGGYLDANLNPLTIAIANSDLSGRVTLDHASVTGGDPGDAGTGYSNEITIAYNGGIAHGEYAVFTASAPGYPTSAMGLPVTLEITPTMQGQYAVTTPAFGQWAIANGPDGRIWYAERTQSAGPGVVGALNISTGAVSEYPDPSTCCYPVAITAGSDGNMWVVEYPFNNGGVGAVAKLTPSGTYTEYPLNVLPSLLNYAQIVSGSDGNLYLPTQNIQTSVPQAYLTKIVPSTGAMTNIAIRSGGSDIPVIGTGYSDGRIYWVVRYPNGANQSYAIGYYTPSSGTMTTIPTVTALTSDFDSGPFVGGPDGKLYFGGTTEVFDPSTATWTSYGCINNGSPIVGADGRLYQLAAANTARFTPSTQYCDGLYYFTNGFQASFVSLPGQAIVGPDGNFWTFNGTYFGKIEY